jgi:hypothetical protein
VGLSPEAAQTIFCSSQSISSFTAMEIDCVLATSVMAVHHALERDENQQEQTKADSYSQQLIA